MIVMTYRELFAWFLVLLFAGAAVGMYFWNPNSSSEATVAPPVENTPIEPSPTEEPDVQAAPSCSDGLKNQGESDIDCGGTCGKCSNGKSCDADADCQSADCVSGVCKAAPSLSGNVDFVIKDVDFETNAASAKVTEIEITLTNGLSKTLDAEVLIYAKSYNDVYYLNQIDSFERDEDRPYATVNPPAIASGKSITQSFPVSGPFMGNWQDTDATDVGDEGFSLEIYVIDADTGDLLKKVKKGVRV